MTSAPDPAARPSAGAHVVAVLLGVVGVFVRRAGVPDLLAGAAFTGVAIATVVALARWRDWTWAVRSVGAVVAVGALVVAYRSGLVKPVAAVMSSSVVAAGALVRWPPVGRERAAARAPIAVGPVVAAAWAWSRSPSTVTQAIWCAVGVVLLEVATRWPVVLRPVERVVDALVLVVRDLFVGAIWVLSVLPVWVASTVTRASPFGARRPNRSTWLSSAPHDLVGPRRAGTREPAPVGRSRLRGALRSLIVVLLLAPVVGAVGWRLSHPPRELVLNDLPFTSYAHEDEPFAEDLFREVLEANHRPDLMLGSRNDDVRGRYLNVVDGRRVSYRPADPVLTVWFFGGSTMYGIGQRDDHTIPSVVARRAEDAGVRIDPVNFGVSGDTNWVETIRFVEALEGASTPPDLVVFYDGANDASLGWQRANRGNRLLEETSRLPMSAREEELFTASAPEAPTPLSAEDDVELRTELAAAQYGSGVDLARRVAAVHGVPVVHFWQPMPESKRLAPSDDGLLERLQWTPEMQAAAGRIYREMAKRSAADVIDLSGAFDDVDRPVFFDQSHTNELGARVVGTAIFDEVLPRLRSLERGR